MSKFLFIIRRDISYLKIARLYRLYLVTIESKMIIKYDYVI